MFKLSKISPAEVLMLLAEGGHIWKTMQGDKKLEEKFKKVADEFEKGNMKTVEKILNDVDINTFIDENLYSDALAQIGSNFRDHLDNLMYKLAKGTEEEQAMARNVIACVATNTDVKRRVAMVKEMADCQTLAKLKKLIYARGWDRPDEPIVNMAKKIITAFRDKAIPGIGKGFESAGQGIKKVAEKVSTETGKANQRMSENLQTSGLIAWSERLLAKSKK